jgi:hypothetical protein
MILIDVNSAQQHDEKKDRAGSNPDTGNLWSLDGASDRASGRLNDDA